MATKSDTPPAAPAAEAAAGAKPEVDAKKPSALAPWLPVLAALVLAPVLTWAVAEYVLLPRLQKKLTAIKAGDTAEKHEAAAPEAKAEGAKEGKEHGKEGGNPANYEFQNVVVNLSGTMGTRYLKTTFLVTGADATIKATFESQKAKLTDITLNVLSSLSLADLEEPGSKNILREKLVQAYNQALGKRVAEQVYFSDFVVQ
ncbi:MAG: flagellar basal body-associated FliL family protein [Opitutae bacterium]|nr:flagellar basal body-associated FliL family protein [Opitutae bacterium]